MSKVVIYTGNLCGYCTMAKRLLTQKGLTFTEINVDHDPKLRQQMIERTQCRTVPQIYIGDYHIGGCDDLYALERNQQLEQIIATYLT
ncbi:MAG: glutaredoxin 3 [Pseudomonadota bacterium]|jgi:glutaredoxin 3